MNSVTEIWKSVPGFPNYEVSSLGRVKSLDRIVTRVCRWGSKDFRWKGRIMKPVLHHTGYLITKLGAAKGFFRYHQLVAWAFIGPQTEGMTINHKDGNKLNNTPENLEYITSTENVKHAYRTGLLSNKGETNGKAKLTEEIVRKIKSYPLTVSGPKVAALVGCKPHNVWQVRAGAWSHVA